MLRKVIAAATIGALLLGGSCGCNIADLSRDNLLRPPKSMGDEAEIEQLIASTAKDGYTLKYPKSGSNRSAIIMHDLDNDNVDEAIAFFREKDGSTGVHMLVMYVSDDEWKVSANFNTETTDVDCVAFADIDDSSSQEILTGYATYTPGVNFLAVYRYRNGKTEMIEAGQNYSAFYCGVTSSDEKNRVFTLSLFSTENEAKASMLEYDKQRKSLYTKASVPMDGNVVSYKNVSFTDLGDNVRGLVVDGLLTSGGMNTQVLYYDSLQNALLNPLYRESSQNPTQRGNEVVSADVSNDMKCEIPTVHALPYNATSGAVSSADQLVWNHFDAKTDTLLPQQRTVANYKFGYTVKLPDRWMDGTFTALLDESGSQMSFYEWDKENIAAKLFDIAVYKVSDWDQGIGHDTHTLIYKDNRYAYTFKNEKSGSALALDDNEIKTAFSLLGRSTANSKS